MATLSYEEFRALAALEEAERTGAPAPALPERVAGALLAKGYMRFEPRGGVIDSRGLAALEPYRVRRAIVLAAGRGVRMLPATLDTPKSMVRAGGKPLVEYALDALEAAEVDEVHVVRGYRAERLDELLERHPRLHFIENPRYAETNNITSLAAAREHIPGAYIMDADLAILEPRVIARYQYRSNYLGIPLDRAEGWCFRCDAAGRILGAGPDVTENVHQIEGISNLTPEDGARLAHDLMDVLARPEGLQRYWDTVAIQYFPERYRVHVRPCAAGDVRELDTFEELQAFNREHGAALGGTR